MSWDPRKWASTGAKWAANPMWGSYDAFSKQFDPGGGYDTMAKGAGAAGGRSEQFSGQQWGRQMEGLDKAWGAYGPASDYADRMGNRGPGAMENWWSQNGYKFDQPTASGGALDAYKQWMGRPGAAEGAYNDAYGMLGKSNTADIYSQFGSALGGRRSDAENYYTRTGSQYEAPSKAEDLYGTFDSQYRTMMGQVNQRNAKQFDELQKSGRTEDYRPEYVSQAQAFAKMLPQMQGVAQLEQGAGEIGGYFRGANQASDYYGSQAGALKGPGVYEQFVTSDIMGDNPALAMERDEGLAALNQEMARRGAFNSGAAATGLGKYLGTFQAKSYENRANRAQQAQQMQLGRIGQGTSTAQAAAQGMLGQGGALQGLAGARDSEKRARLDQIQASANAASSEGLANQRLQLDANRGADEMRLARLDAQGRAGAQGTDQLLRILSGLGAAGGASDDALLRRLSAGSDAAGASDAGLLNRLGALYNMGSGADANALDRAGAMYGMGTGMDRLNMDKYGMLGDMAGQFDQATLARLMGAGNMAGNAQDAEGQRMRDAFSSLLGVGSGRAGAAGNFYGNAGQLSGNAMSDSINALMAQYGYKGMGETARARMPWDMASLLMQFYGAGGGKGGRG